MRSGLSDQSFQSANVIALGEPEYGKLLLKPDVVLSREPLFQLLEVQAFLTLKLELAECGFVCSNLQFFDRVSLNSSFPL